LKKKRKIQLSSKKPKKRRLHQLMVVLKEKEAAEEELDVREENIEAEKEVSTVATEEAIEEVVEEEDHRLPLSPSLSS